MFGLRYFSIYNFRVFSSNGTEPMIATITVNGSTTEQIVCIEIEKEAVATGAIFDVLTNTLYLQGVSVYRGMKDTGDEFRYAVIHFEDSNYNLLEFEE